MRKWVELFDEPRRLFLSYLGPFVGVSSSSKKNLCEVDVHTVYQRLFKKLANARYTPCNTFLLILHAYTVKSPNKGHIGDGPFVPCREVVLFSEVLF